MTESKSENFLVKRWKLLDSFEVFGKTDKKEALVQGLAKAAGMGSVENNISQFLSRGPAKNIFFTFVSNFLQKKNGKEKVKSIFKKPSRVKINVNSNVESQDNTPAVSAGEAVVKRNTKGVSTKNYSTKSVMFPSLRPNNSLHTFLQREKTRLEASQTERLLLMKKPINGQKQIIKTSKVKQPREKEFMYIRKKSKKSKKPAKRTLSALII